MAHKEETRTNPVSSGYELYLNPVEHSLREPLRELENAIERAIVLGSSEVLLAEDLPENLLERHVPADVS